MAAIVRGLSKLPKTSLTRTLSCSTSKFAGEGKDVDFETHTGQVLFLSLLLYSHFYNGEPNFGQNQIQNNEV